MANGVKSRANSKSDVWAVIGKLSVLVGLLLAAFTLYKHLAPAGPDIVAYCSATSVSIQNHPLFQECIQLFRSSGEDPSRFKRELYYYELYEAGPTGELEYLYCRIENVGNEEAEDIILKLPARPLGIAINDKAIDPNSKGRIVTAR